MSNQINRSTPKKTGTKIYERAERGEKEHTRLTHGYLMMRNDKKD